MSTHETVDPALGTEPAAETVRTRREEYAESTYAALLDSAATCFLENGFVATSLDAVAKRARLTKGAIYHHFASKRDLFMAVLEREEARSAQTVTQAGAAAPDAWSGIVAAFDTFLETISDPTYQRLCWVEGPAALGFEDWWACGERYEIGVIRAQLDRAADAGVLVVQDLDMMAHVLFGAVAAGVLAMARSEEPARERERFRATMLDVIKGVVNMDVAAQ
jgi:AcrR family transcriptional regulator